MIQTLLLATVATLPLLVPRFTDNITPVDLIAVVFLVTALWGLMLRRHALKMPAAGVLLTLLFVSGIATAIGIDPAAGVLSLVTEIYLILLFWTVATVLDGDERRLRIVLSVWTVAALFWAALVVGAHFHLLPHALADTLSAQSSSSRPAGAARNPNLAAGYFLTSVFVLAASPWPRRPPARWLAAAWLVVAIYATGSNGALLALPIGAATLAIGHVRWRIPRERGWTDRGIVVLALGAAVLVASAGLLSAQGVSVNRVASAERGGVFDRNVGRLNDSVATRERIWSSALQAGVSDATIGVGPNAGAALRVNGQPLGKSLHNDYIAFLVERGVVGFALLLTLFVVVLGWCGRLMRRPGPTTRADRRLYGLAAAVVADMVFAATHESFHFRHLWLLFALVWVASRLRRQYDAPLVDVASTTRQERQHALA